MLLLLLLLLLQQLLTIQVDTIYYIHIIFYLILMRIDFAVATHMVPVIFAKVFVVCRLRIESHQEKRSIP